MDILEQDRFTFHAKPENILQLLSETSSLLLSTPLLSFWQEGKLGISH